jgi:hypothetical protein
MHLQRFAKLLNGTVVIAQEKEKSAVVKIDRRERVELGGTLHLRERFLIASEQCQTEAVVVGNSSIVRI